MDMTKEALKLFLQSLPEGSFYDIVSFGSKFFATGKKRMGLINDDANIKSTKKDVDRYIANMGGTAIFDPLSYSINEFMSGANF